MTALTRTISDNQARALAFWTTLFNAHNLPLVDDFFAPGFINHNARPGTPAGPRGARELFTRLWDSSSDMHFEVQTMIAQADQVVCIGIMRGTHDGLFHGIPATHRATAARHIHVLTFDDAGLITDHLAVRDDVTVLRQLGALPNDPPEPAPPPSSSENRKRRESRMYREHVDPSDPRNVALDYYNGPEIVDTLLDALIHAGLDPDALDIDDLALLDEFHALGRAATLALAELTGLQPNDRVLDVGAGIGGPARFLAACYGAHVTALDATPRFCRAAELLTRGAGLADRVRVVCGDALALPFPDSSFDLAWTQSVSQNIADKQRFIAELARIVRPGGRVSLFEVVTGPGGSLEFPVPWADRQAHSWLVTAEELHALLDSGPLTIVAWKEGPAVLDAISSAAKTIQTPPADHPLGLHLLMPDFQARMGGLARNVAQHKIALVQAVARRRD
jgi:steroid delta-isomerase-like uncharacterized protein